MQNTKWDLSAPTSLLWIGIGTVLAGAILGGLVLSILVQFGSHHVTETWNAGSMADTLERLSRYPAGRNWLRLGIMANTLFTFALPAVVTLYIGYRRNWAWAAALRQRWRPTDKEIRGSGGENARRGEYSDGPPPLLLASTPAPRRGALHPRPRPENGVSDHTDRGGWQSGLWTVLTFVSAMPLVAWLTYWNFTWPLPEWALRGEASTDRLLGYVLTMDTPAELLLALATVGLAAGLGEELLLRGLLQHRILRPLLGNEHAAIWIAALLFSVMHWEFAGIVPRLMLGALLGYSLRWTGTLWWPIGLHVAFNGLQVLQVYLTGEFVTEPVVEDLPGWWSAGVGTLVAGYGVWRLERR